MLINYTRDEALKKGYNYHPMEVNNSNDTKGNNQNKTSRTSSIQGMLQLQIYILKNI